MFETKQFVMILVIRPATIVVRNPITGIQIYERSYIENSRCSKSSITCCVGLTILDVVISIISYDIQFLVPLNRIEFSEDVICKS